MNIAQIQKRIEMIDKLEDENRISKETLKQEMDNDDEYTRVNGEAKEALSRKKRVKDQILAKDQNQQIIDQIKANNEEIATLKEILSTELVEVYQIGKTDEIQDSTGETRKFKLVAKISTKKL